MSSPGARDPYEVLMVRPDAHEAVIRAAYRALASLYHPDSDDARGATARMAELNDAYATIRTADRRAVHDLGNRRAAPAPSAVVPPSASHSRRAPAAKSAGGVLDLGRYRGWSLADLAKHDPDYLRWLSRHSSGLRYRGEIEGLLRKPGPPPIEQRPGRRR